MTRHKKGLLLLLCSHSLNDIPPEPQRTVSVAAVRGAVRPSNRKVYLPSMVYISCLHLPQTLGHHSVSLSSFSYSSV